MSDSERWADAILGLAGLLGHRCADAVDDARVMVERLTRNVMLCGTIEIFSQQMPVYSPPPTDGARNPSIDDISRTAGTGVDSLLISVASPVTLHAFDSEGRHTGLIPIPNPTPSEFTGIEEAIPSGSLSSAGHNTYLGLAPDDRYRIELRGQAYGTFTLKLEEFLDNNLLSAASYVDVPVSPRTKANFTIQHVADASQLQLDVDGDGTIDFTLTPGTQPNTLASLQILTAMVRALGLPAGRENSLVSKLEAAASALQRGDHQAVAGVLGAFKNELQAQKGKDIPPADAIGLIGIANNLLTSL